MHCYLNNRSHGLDSAKRQETTLEKVGLTLGRWPEMSVSEEYQP